MRDAVDLIVKKIVIKEKTYIINDVNFLPHPAQPLNHIWFGLKFEGSILNYPYDDLLPYLQEQIKL
jgi:hypothetical protein